MVKQLQLPLSEEQVRSLQLGDQVELSGRIYTARDAVHKHLSEANQEQIMQAPDLRNAVFYHCGPVIIEEQGAWKVTAAGPTTSMREEPYMAGLIEKFSLRAVIGKGGMGAKAAAACKRFGCVYLHALGGAAQVLADAVKNIPTVHYLEEFGFPEALWCFEVERFPAVVSMDAQGNSLHEQVLQASLQQKKALCP